MFYIGVFTKGREKLVEVGYPTREEAIRGRIELMTQIKVMALNLLVSGILR